MVAAVGWDVRIWNRATRLVCKELVGHSAPILCMECAGATVITGSQDRTAKLWTLHSEDVEHTLTGHTGPVAAVAMYGTHAATLAHEIRIWDIATGTCLYTLDVDAHAVAFTGLVLGAGVAIAACSDNTLHVWRHEAPGGSEYVVSLGEHGVSGGMGRAWCVRRHGPCMVCQAAWAVHGVSGGMGVVTRTAIYCSGHAGLCVRCGRGLGGGPGSGHGGRRCLADLVEPQHGHAMRACPRDVRRGRSSPSQPDSLPLPLYVTTSGPTMARCCSYTYACHGIGAVDVGQYAAYSVGSGEHTLVLGDRCTGHVVQLFELHHAGSRVTHYELPEPEDVVDVDYDACGVLLKFAQADGSSRLMLRDYTHAARAQMKATPACTIS